MKTHIRMTILLLTLLLLSGCANTMEPAFPTSTFPPPITAEPSLPTTSPQPTTTFTPAPTLTPTPYQPFTAVVTIDNLFLRSGPGFLLPALEMYDAGKTVEVLGRAPGWSWVYVATGDGLHGFMKLELLDLKGDFYDAPEIIPEGFVIIKGHVYAPSGDPASHITLTLTPPDGDTARNDAATTDALGQYYFFLPQESKGTWTLLADAYGCESSAVNADCSLIGGLPPAMTINVNDSADVWYNLQMTKP